MMLGKKCASLVLAALLALDPLGGSGVQAAGRQLPVNQRQEKSLQTGTALRQADGQLGLTKIGETTATEISKEEMQTKTAGLRRAAGSKNAFYKELRSNLVKKKTSFQIAYKGSYESMSDIDQMLDGAGSIDKKNTSDDGDFMMGSILKIGYNCQYSGSQCLYYFTLQYTESAAQVKKLNKTIDKVLTKLNVADMENIAKIKAIHDYVVNLVTYDRTMIDHSAYGGLVDGKHTTVCQGYALIMYKMLTEAGVPAHYVTGYAGEAHAWNIVKVGGKWYYLDATWDDPMSAEPVLTYDYFLVGANTLGQDHSTDQKYLQAYSIPAGDYNWKAALKKANNKSDEKVPVKQTPEEEELAQEASERQDFMQTLTQTLDESLEYDKAGEEEQILYDLYKKIVTSVIGNLSDEAFQYILSNSDALEAMMDQCGSAIEVDIINPVLEYMQSDDFVTAACESLVEDFGQELLDEAGEDELDSLLEAYMYQCFYQLFNSVSEEYTEDIILQVIASVEEQVS